MGLQTHRLTMSITVLTLLQFASVSAEEIPPPKTDRPWPRHVIDGSSRGADGVRLHDVNNDGLPDITTGWEEGGVTRVYLHPGHSEAMTTWPAVTVAMTPSVEDAVFCDVDGDGAVDVISSCEGKTRRMFIHWAPRSVAHYLNPDSWETETITVTEDRTQWMFALPMQIDGKNGTDIVVASKGKDGLVGWLQAPANPRQMGNWKLHTLYKAGWIMSLAPLDVDADGDLDVIVSDRKGENSGVLWLENPGAASVSGNWMEHRIGGDGLEIMFLDIADLDEDGHPDVIAAVKPNQIHWFRNPAKVGKKWPVQVIEVNQPVGMGTAKGVRVGDVDGNGKPDIVYSCEKAVPPKRGLVWLSFRESPTEKVWTVHDISGPEGIKYDRVELSDIDGDGDLDVLTCEERHQGVGIGVFWHENPLENR